MNLSVAETGTEVIMVEGIKPDVKQSVAELSILTGAEREPDNQRGLSLETELNLSVTESVGEFIKAEGETPEAKQSVAELRVVTGHSIQ